MNPKYPALTTIAGFYRILAWLTGILTTVMIVIGIISAFVSGTYIGGGLFAFLGEVLGAVFGSLVFVFAYGLVGFVIATLQLYIAEVLQLFMDIEANTQK